MHEFMATDTGFFLWVGIALVVGFIVSGFMMKGL